MVTVNTCPIGGQIPCCDYDIVMDGKFHKVNIVSLGLSQTFNVYWVLLTYGTDGLQATPEWLTRSSIWCLCCDFKIAIH